MTFNDFNLSDEIEEAISFMGYTSPTPIQEEAIPYILEGNDLIGCAQTGTGKTAAFLIPLLEKLAKSTKKGIKALIIVPTRELAQQIDENFIGISYFTNTSSIAIYGGNQPELFANQKKALQQGVDVVIATPGRLLAHENLGYVDFSDLETLILDEADRMLEMGFIDDIMKIIKKLPAQRQTLLFSATMKADIRKLAHKILTDPKQINLAVSKPAEGVNQQAYLVKDENKIQLLEYIIQHSKISNMIIFAATKSEVDTISRRLNRINIECNAIHSDKDQQERNEMMRMFKAQKFKVLVATDIVSRGIDIDGLSHVVNFSVPDDPADYVHRVGRTARADKKGISITFINDSKEQLYFQNIEQLIEKELEKNLIPSDIGESPLYEPKRYLRSKGRKGGGKRRFQKKKGYKPRNRK